MIDTPTTLAELAQRHPYGIVEVGGHRWLISQYGDRTELSGFSSGQLPTVTIAETLGAETRGIVSFEQASAIALTMPDYVIELMRIPDDTRQSFVSTNAA